MHRLLAPFLFILSLLPHFAHHQTPLEKMVDRVAGSVLHILAEKTEDTMFGPEHGQYSCTGFIVDTRVGVTAHHCLGDNMTADGHRVLVLKADERLDLAVFLVNSSKPPMRFFVGEMHRFQQVYGVGYGFGFGRLTVTPNSVMLQGYSPHPESMAPGVFVFGTYVHGMSGGPVVDADGDVVGMIQQTNEGIGYGVGAQAILDFLEQP